ncbi:hypothetical protein LCGC14_1096380 [marine sediment metagenome]|uniref:Portal protein n=1 Tax=marine sediment metagenome TaxID=412755 RepID=A0A0F9PTY9_9ZZZZ
MSHESDILAQARQQYDTAREDDKTERLLADEDLRFAINDEGCQWDVNVRNSRKGNRFGDPGRPCLVMNKIPEKIDQTEGEFRQLKPSVKVKGVDSKADPKVAEIFSGIFRHIEYNSTARAAYNTSHSSVLYCGRGAWRWNIIDSEDDPFEQDLVIDRIPNALSVTWDQAAKKIDKSDGNFIFITEDMFEKDFKKEYPDAALDDWPTDDDYRSWRRNNTIRIAEYWWKEKGTKTAYRVRRNGTEMTVWDQEEGDQEIAKKDVNHPKIRWCKMIATKILEGPFDDWPGKYIPIVIEVGKEVNINGKSKTRGMVRFAKEPQRMYNYWTSSEAEQIALAPKAPYLVTPAMIKNHQAQWDKANIENFIYLLWDVDPKAPLLGPKRESPPQMSTAMIAAKQSMEHDIMSAMNVYRAQLGDSGSEKSGKAIIARQKQGSIGGFTYTDNFEFALIFSAKIGIDLIPHVYGTERIIRIRGESDVEHVIPINARPGSPILTGNQELDEDYIVQPRPGITEYINDLTVGKYDVVATIGPSWTTQREEALERLVSLFEIMPNLANASPDIIVGLLDMPLSDELLARAKKLVPKGLRKLDPGEEEEDQGPTPEQMIEIQKLQLAGLEEMRKGFEAKMDATAKLMTAEAKEAGQQLQSIMSFVETMQERFSREQPQGSDA